MKLGRLWTVLSIISVFIVLMQAEAAMEVNQVREMIKGRMEATMHPEKVVCRGIVICGSTVLPLFYKNRFFLPAWFDYEGPIPAVQALIRGIQDAEKEGLRFGEYHLNTILSLLRDINTGVDQENRYILSAVADLDMLLTDAFLIHASHLLHGRVDPETIKAESYVKSEKGDVGAILQAALDSNDIEGALKKLPPPQEGYTRLRSMLWEYRDMASKGGWEKVPDGGKMVKGDSGERVNALIRRLLTSSDLDSGRDISGDLFDEELEKAVLRFQRRHGLLTDGVVGMATLKALNVTVEQRIRQIEANMERWRWLPRSLGNRYLSVNIANFELEVVEDTHSVMTMRSIVGKPYQRTPVFNARMTYLVLNPYWNVPSAIAKKEILPLIRKDPAYLSKNNFKTYSVWGPERIEVDPATVEWSKITRENFPFFFRQEAGPLNALGSIKFMFPNKFNVYLHDTPHRELFKRPVRGFSHGCIRIEKPMELAEYLLKKDPRWTRERILDALNTSVNKVISLPQPIEVYILYLTAWVSPEGDTQFRDDLYHRDEPLTRALEQMPPGP